MRHAVLVAACLIILGVAPARSDILVHVDKVHQRMAVIVDGVPRYVWRVSTGLDGGPPAGRYRPQRMERKWYSRRYNWSPMPHAIFFHKGYAIHGTNYVSRLGTRASHGCVRLRPDHAAQLFALVSRRGMRNARILIDPGVSPMLARRQMGRHLARGE